MYLAEEYDHNDDVLQRDDSAVDILRLKEES